jgi:hypothetical protein
VHGRRIALFLARRSTYDPNGLAIGAGAGPARSRRRFETLVVLGDPQVTAPPGRPRGAMLRAYDKNDGTEVGAVWMPAQQSGSPMTYMAGDRQYIVVAVSGGVYSGEYIAFALPNAGRPTTQAQR